MSHRKLFTLIASILCSFSLVTAQKGPAPAKRNPQALRAVADFDIRPSLVQGAPRGPIESEQSLQSAPNLRARVTRRANGRPRSISAGGQGLNASPDRDKEQLVRSFLQREARAFSFLPKGRDQLRLVSSDESPRLSVLFFQQYIAGVPVFEGSLKASLNGAGDLIQVDAGELLPGLSIGSTPTLTGPQAIASAYRWTESQPPGAISRRSVIRGGRSFFQVENGPDVATELVVFPLRADAGRLAYRVFLQIDGDRYYEIVVDAADGSLLLRQNLVRQAGQARIWKESPLLGPRELVTFPEGWLPPASLVTTGNNTDVFMDTNGDGRPDTAAATGISGGRAFSPSQVFDFLAPEGDGVNPAAATFRAASVTNLFYLVNAAHDYFYSLGFDEAAGNFQTDNFSRGGIGGDAIVVYAQSGASFNGAAFASPAEGLPGMMRVGIFTNGTTTPLDDRDAAYDGAVIVHEYGHGVSTRLVGGPSVTTCLRGVQSGAMGEGWSDYFAASFYSVDTVGAYSTQTLNGFRRHSYANYPFTYEDIGNSGYRQHPDGEIWAATLLDIRRILGAPATDLLVINGLKLTPCNPSMVDARDAILAADQTTNGGANRDALWQVFARHGLGFSAQGTDGGFGPTGVPRLVYYVAAFDLPRFSKQGTRPLE